MILHMLPNVITHNYHPARGAFRNVCHLPFDDAERIISLIRAEGASSLRADYLGRRMRTEDWLVGQRIRKLGRTPLARPIYFFLGNMADGADKSRPASIIVPLADFDPGVLTFTFPDSMHSYPQARGPGYVAQPYHGQVFTLSEITDVVCRQGFPNPLVPRAQRGEDGFIEVQVWDDRPLVQYRP